jgi:hypothetical protein
MIKEKWMKMSLAQQMGNIGSEFSRMISLKQKGDLRNAQNSFDKTLELLDLTISQRKNRELFRLREVICDLFIGSNVYKVSTKYLKDYFLFFALSARNIS